MRSLRLPALSLLLLLLASVALVAPLLAQTADSDGDGVYDENDQCKYEPEDWDGYEDSDGCPDPDNDRDGVEDADDPCPNDPTDACLTETPTPSPAPPAIGKRNDTSDPFEALARDFVDLLAEPTPDGLAALLPTVDDVQWIVQHIVPAQYRTEYPAFYADPELREDLLRGYDDFELLESFITDWQQVTPVLPMERVTFGGYEVLPTDDLSRADGRSHLIDVVLNFGFEGFGELRFKATLFVAETPEHVALFNYHLTELSPQVPWSQPTPVWDAYVSSMVEVIRSQDSERFHREFYAPASSRAWYVANRAPVKYRASFESDFTDESYDEGFAEGWRDLLETVYAVLPDAAEMELVRYAPFGGEHTEDGVLLEMRTPSIRSAVFAIPAMQGIDKFYYALSDFEVSMDPDDTEEYVAIFEHNLHDREEEKSLAAFDARRRKREETVAECPGFEEAERILHANEPTSPAVARSRLESSEALLACPRVAELLGTRYHSTLARRAYAFLWLGKDRASDIPTELRPGYLRNAVETFGAALAVTEQAATANRTRAESYRRNISEVSVTAYEAAVKAQGEGQDELVNKYLTAAAAGISLLDPDDLSTSTIRSYTGYAAGVAALRNGESEDARRFLPLVVPPSPELLTASDAALAEALSLDAATSAILYFNLGAVTYNHAAEMFDQQSNSARPDYAEILPLIEDVRTCMALTKRLDPTFSGVDETLGNVELLVRKVGAAGR